MLAGAIQYLFVPDLTAIGGGWDPHQGRLVSTWLDPNFVGMFLCMAACVLLAHSVSASRRRLLYGVVLLVVLLEVLLTQSRSTILAVTTSLIVVSPVAVITLRHPSTQTWIRAAATLGLLLVIIGSGILLLGERAWGVVTFDPTVELRQAALRTTWQLATDTPFIGIGYNTFQFAAQSERLISDFTIHSRSGADNSLLTLLITTGLPGVVLFLLPWVVIGSYCMRDWLHHHNPFSLAALISGIALLIHSQFVNSFLYTHLLITVILIVVLALKTSPTWRSSSSPHSY